MAAGVVVGLVGLDALRHVRRREELPLASLPLAFGVHQGSEAFVWWGLQGDVAPATGRAALWVYLVFAVVVLPVLVPLAVLLVEPDRARRRLIGRLMVLGLLVAAAYAAGMLRGPVDAAVGGQALAYRTGVPHGGTVAALYTVATVGALLCSSHRRIALFGLANLVAVPVLVSAAAHALTSLWCFWAAVASTVVAAHQRSQEDPAVPPPGWAGAVPATRLRP